MLTLFFIHIKFNRKLKQELIKYFIKYFLLLYLCVCYIYVFGTFWIEFDVLSKCTVAHNCATDICMSKEILSLFAF